MCGIWIGIGGTKRVRKYNNKNIRMGRKILLVYMIIVILREVYQWLKLQTLSGI